MVANPIVEETRTDLMTGTSPATDAPAEAPPAAAENGSADVSGRPLAYARPTGFQAAQQWHTLPVLQPSLAGFYFLITFGLFGLIHYQGLHDRLPKNRRDDPSAARAIWLMLVPGFNLWWMFFANLRLLERIDEQRRLAGLPERPLKALCISMLVMMLIPWVNIFSFLVVHPIYIAALQTSINELCEVTA